MRKLLLSLFLITNVSLAYGGEITGSVVFDKDLGGRPIANTLVRLHVYKDDYEFSGAEVRTNSKGMYRFSNLEAGERFAYIVYPIYKDVSYPYKEIVLTEEEPKMNQFFFIRETTGSTKDISADESIFIDFGKKDIWKVTHEITIQNNGEFLYHPDRPDTEPIQFSLFNGGFDLSYLEGVSRNNSNIDDEKDVLQIFMTLGPHDPVKLKFSYYYFPEKRRVDFDRTAFQKRSNVSLFLRKNVKIKSKQFQLDKMLGDFKKDYRFAYTSGPIEASNPIQFSIYGFYMHRDFLHGMVLTACLLLILVLVLSVLQLRKSEKSFDKELTERMHRYLIELKAKLKNGDIDEKEYKNEADRIVNFLFQKNKK